MAIPSGELSCAATAGPLSPPEPAAPGPAMVLITPAGVTMRMRLLEVSAMYQLPLESTAIPEGEYNCAAVAGPPSPPKFGAVPLPAMVTGAPPFGISITNTLEVK